MKIHGKKLEQTNDGNGIYYDNILITNKTSGLNEGRNFEDWVKIIEADVNFDPRMYHPNLFGKNKITNTKVYLNRTVKNVIEKDTFQSVTIEKEEDDTVWCIVRHDNEELSMSHENLKILSEQINNALTQFDEV